MATIIDLPLAAVKGALKVAYDQAARAEKNAESKYGIDSPITKELMAVRLKLNSAIISAKDNK